MGWLEDSEPIGERLLAVASLLQRDLRTVLAAVGLSEEPRPVALVRILRLDKSMASRIARAARAKTSAEAMVDIPSPEGLQMVLSAAMRLGCPLPLIQRFDDSIRSFELLLRTVPGGRGGVDSILVELLPEQRLRSELRARQSVFRAMQFLTGSHVDVSYNLNVYAPSAQPDRVDLAWVAMRDGFRRLRTAESRTQFLRMRGGRHGLDAPGEVLDLSGRVCESPTQCLIPEFCSDPLPEVQAYSDPTHFMLALEPGSPPVNVPVTLTAGQWWRGTVPRFSSSDRRYEYSSFRSRWPCELMIVETMVHREIFHHDSAFVTNHMDEAIIPSLAEPPRDEMSETGQTVNIQRFDFGELPSAVVPGSPIHEVAPYLFSHLPWPRSEFALFRMVLKFPLPMVKMRLWFELGDPPNASSED